MVKRLDESIEEEEHGVQLKDFLKRNKKRIKSRAFG